MPIDEANASLDAIGIRCNTDKASRAIRHDQEVAGHDYLRHYERAIRGLGRRPELVVDLGVGPPPREFASARMWAEFLPDARIVGVDIKDLGALVPPRVEFIRGDLGDVGFVASLTARLVPDIVVEDASHLWQHQLLSLFYFLPVVRPGGIYIWEDLHVSAPSYASRYADGAGYSPVEFLRLLAGEVAMSQAREERHRGRATAAGPSRGPRLFGSARQAQASPEPVESPEGADSPADAKPATSAVGLPEMMASALAPLIDSITIVRSAAILVRSA